LKGLVWPSSSLVLGELVLSGVRELRGFDYRAAFWCCFEHSCFGDWEAKALVEKDEDDDDGKGDEEYKV
jgi:hypothetical protein